MLKNLKPLKNYVIKQSFSIDITNVLIEVREDSVWTWDKNHLIWVSQPTYPGQLISYEQAELQ